MVGAAWLSRRCGFSRGEPKRRQAACATGRLRRGFAIGWTQANRLPIYFGASLRNFRSGRKKEPAGRQRYGVAARLSECGVLWQTGLLPERENLER